MQQHQENVLTMVEVVIAHLDGNPSVWAALPAYVTHVTALKTKRDALVPYLNKQAAKTTGVTKDKQKLKVLAIQQALTTAGNIEVYATDNNDNTLYDNMHFSKSKLLAIPDTELTIKLQAIHDIAASLLISMANYGNTTASLMDFQTRINGYQQAVPKPRNTLVQRKTATLNIAQTFKETNYILKKLDKLSLNFATTDPDFLSEYSNSRQIINYAHHKTRLEISINTTADKPIVKAAIVIILGDDIGINAKTNSEGIALFTDIARGEYALTANADGYPTYTENGIKVQAGKTTHHSIKLIPLD